MSILEVEILLHYYCSGGDFRNLDAPAIKQALKNFCDAGLLVEWNNSDVKYKPNMDAIKPYINAVTSIPLPVKTYVIPPYETKEY